MDFHSLSRKDLQALCKKNKIPANLTNVAMAQHLTALEVVEGIEEFLGAQALQQEITPSRLSVTQSSRRKEENLGIEASLSICRTQRVTRSTASKVALENTLARQREISKPDIFETPSTIARSKGRAFSTRKKVQSRKLDGALDETENEDQFREGIGNEELVNDELIGTPALVFDRQKSVMTTRRKAEPRTTNNALKNRKDSDNPMTSITRTRSKVPTRKSVASNATGMENQIPEENISLFETPARLGREKMTLDQTPDVSKDQKSVMKTTAVRSRLKKCTAESKKEAVSVQRGYSTRRSMRLNDKQVAERQTNKKTEEDDFEDMQPEICKENNCELKDVGADLSSSAAMEDGDEKISPLFAQIDENAPSGEEDENEEEAEEKPASNTGGEKGAVSGRETMVSVVSKIDEIVEKLTDTANLCTCVNASESGSEACLFGGKNEEVFDSKEKSDKSAPIECNMAVITIEIEAAETPNSHETQQFPPISEKSEEKIAEDKENGGANASDECEETLEDNVSMQCNVSETQDATDEDVEESESRSEKEFSSKNMEEIVYDYASSSNLPEEFEVVNNDSSVLDVDLKIDDEEVEVVFEQREENAEKFELCGEEEDEEPEKEDESNNDDSIVLPESGLTFTDDAEKGNELDEDAEKEMCGDEDAEKEQDFDDYEATMKEGDHLAEEMKLRSESQIIVEEHNEAEEKSEILTGDVEILPSPAKGTTIDVHKAEFFSPASSATKESTLETHINEESMSLRKLKKQLKETISDAGVLEDSFNGLSAKKRSAKKQTTATGESPEAAADGERSSNKENMKVLKAESSKELKEMSLRQLKKQLKTLSKKDEKVENQRVPLQELNAN